MAQEKAGQIMEEARDLAGQALNKVYEGAQAAKDMVSGANPANKDKTMGDHAVGFMDAAKGKFSETGQSALNTAQVGKEKTGGAIQATTEQVTTAAVGAADAVKNSLGMKKTGGFFP